DAAVTALAGRKSTPSGKQIKRGAQGCRRPPLGHCLVAAVVSVRRLQCDRLALMGGEPFWTLTRRLAPGERGARLLRLRRVRRCGPGPEQAATRRPAEAAGSQVRHQQVERPSVYSPQL